MKTRQLVFGSSSSSSLWFNGRDHEEQEQFMYVDVRERLSVDLEVRV